MPSPKPKPTRRTQPSKRPPATRRTAEHSPRELARPLRASRPEVKSIDRGFNPGFRRR
ncbi:hypothetical protein KSP35_06115 [Aquihabitans sp. G128]|uniref:hypothetical protein n=1 Tax=Aquihabitans sp. G128 TaxID=2849779 RepID=UPI001C22199E|nr:hypothetical protein [Aquihabitans sp. G128]QXC62376.1 hypothetical protein KSP35_06115 [Aquihabitans sp. G128]